MAAAEQLGSCLRCGYDLRGLSPDLPCPECGLSIAYSRAAPASHAGAHPRWLSTLSYGCLLLILGTTALAFGPKLADTIFPTTPSMSPNAGVRQALIRACLVTFTAVLHSAAIWFVTTRRPFARFDAWRAVVWAARLLSLGPVAAAALIVRGYLTSHFPGDLTLGLCFAAYIPCPAILFLYLARLASGLGCHRAAGHARIVGPVITLCLTAGIAGELIAINRTLSANLIAIMILGLVIGYLWGLIILASLALDFRCAARDTRNQWAQFDASRAD